ncbi:MAG: NUDIX domain-containing protein [Deltaproteobacteria bacterium]|nr:NUDIX domain-containing protein [Deltaproteobacteria bacterium]
MQTFAMVLFVDIRGFTAFAEKQEVAAGLPAFLADFGRAVERSFPATVWFNKGLGDGAMLVREVARTDNPASLFDGVAAAIAEVESAFAALCGVFATQMGVKAELHLGWGLTRGHVHKVTVNGHGDDYVGSNVNKAARLCDAARPFGMAVDAEDFDGLPSEVTARFHRQIRPTKGIGDVEVLVTPEIFSQFVPREKLREAPEVHVAGVCVRGEGDQVEVLLAKRSATRSLFPGLVEGCGGQLRPAETFADGVRRHYRAEFGIEVAVDRDCFCLYEIREPGEPLIPGIRFLCTFKRQLREELASPNHSQVWWCSVDELRRMESRGFIAGLREQFLGLIDRWQARR